MKYTEIWGNSLLLWNPYSQILKAKSPYILLHFNILETLQFEFSPLIFTNTIEFKKIVHVLNPPSLAENDEQIQFDSADSWQVWSYGEHDRIAFEERRKEARVASPYF